MEFLKLLFITLSSLTLTTCTVVNGGRTIFCSRAEITEVRIEDCDREPCKLVKGEELPYEIDFSFQSPKEAKELYLSAFAPYWNVPGTGDYGSNLSTGKTCDDFNITCPAQAGGKFTLKSTLYADPKLENRVGNHEKTGRIRTSWMLTPNNRDSNEDGSQCIFNVEIDLVENN